MLVIGLFYLYHLLFFLLGLAIVRPALGTPRGPGCNRFAVVIPAHNEENVIYQSVRSILGCDYPREKFDVFVIADNCSDRTPELAEAAGAKVRKRFNKNQRGKQYALAWAFEQINLADYDAAVILDADNHIDPGFLRVMDHHLAAGHKVVQGYIETKNPCDSWVTANYAFMMWYMARLQMFRSRIGLSAILGGTGYCVRTDVLRRVGFNVRSLVDDAEYTCQLILAGEKVAYAPGAVVYDQKPVGLGDSLRQRLRWMRGQTQITIQYIPQMVLCILRNWLKGDIGQAARAFDAIMWVPMHLVIVYSVIASLFGNAPFYLLSVVITIPLLQSLPVLAERVTLHRIWIYLVTAGVFFFTWVPITVYGVLTHDNQVWWRTPH